MRALEICRSSFVVFLSFADDDPPVLEDCLDLMSSGADVGGQQPSGSAHVPAATEGPAALSLGNPS